jgi:hypothetical protein
MLSSLLTIRTLLTPRTLVNLILPSLRQTLRLLCVKNVKMKRKDARRDRLAAMLVQGTHYVNAIVLQIQQLKMLNCTVKTVAINI